MRGKMISQFSITDELIRMQKRQKLLCHGLTAPFPAEAKTRIRILVSECLLSHINKGQLRGSPKYAAHLMHRH